MAASAPALDFPEGGIETAYFMGSAGASTTTIVHSGWLLKRGDVNTAWRRRFFVLTRGGNLLYAPSDYSNANGLFSNAYSIPNESALLTSIKWSGDVALTAHCSVQDTSVTPVEIAHHKSGAGSQAALHAAWQSVACSFQIQSKTNPRVWFLSASAPHERQLWVAKINEVIAALKLGAASFVVRLLAIAPPMPPPQQQQGQQQQGSAFLPVAALWSSAQFNGVERVVVKCHLNRSPSVLGPDACLNGVCPTEVFVSPESFVQRGSNPNVPFASITTGVAPTFQVGVDGAFCGEAALAFSVHNIPSSAVDSLVQSLGSLFSKPSALGTAVAVSRDWLAAIPVADPTLTLGAETIVRLPLLTSSSPSSPELLADLVLGVARHPDPFAVSHAPLRREFGTTQDYQVHRVRVTGDSAVSHETLLVPVGSPAGAPPLLRAQTFRGTASTNGPYVEVMDAYRNPLFTFCRLDCNLQWYVCAGAFGGLRICSLKRKSDVEDDDDDDDDDDECDAVCEMLANAMDSDATVLHGSTIEIAMQPHRTVLTRCIQLEGLGGGVVQRTWTAPGTRQPRHEEIEIALFDERDRVAVAPQEDYAFIMCIEEGYRNCVHVPG